MSEDVELLEEQKLQDDDQQRDPAHGLVPNSLSFA